MAVYTTLEHGQLKDWVAQYDLGNLVSFEGISSGIENSNFFITLRNNSIDTRYVLTLFERLNDQQLPYYLSLMQHLAIKGIPCPDPQAMHSGRLLGTLHDKPAAIVNCLRGSWQLKPTSHHCGQIGDLLAALHIGAADYTAVQANQRDFAWCLKAAQRVTPFLNDHLRALLSDELSAQTQFKASDSYALLPSGAIHGDLFCDNALFEGDQLSGVIDFYFAGNDKWLFDLAITANDWCIQPETGVFDLTKLNALLDAYRKRRALTALEIAHWPLMTRAAALRFWLSRLDDWYSPRPAAQLTPKDPIHFERILLSRRNEPHNL